METNGENKNHEIDIIQNVKCVFSEWKLLILFIIVFMIIGIIVALNTQKRYTSNVILAPEIGSSMGMSESISDLASMVGVDIANGSKSMDAIYPQIYPDIFASTDFIVGLFNVQVKQTDENTSKTYYNHLITDRLIPFWSYPSIWIEKAFTKKEPGDINNKVNPFKLTKTQYNIVSMIRSNITCMIDKKTNVITISIIDNDPLVAASIADTVTNRLKDYITDYRTQKAKNDLAYAKKIYIEAKESYTKARQLYSSYSDANVDLILESFKSKQEDLENDLQLKYNIYSQSVQQLQTAKAKVQENTPVFTIIQKSSVPLKASSTPRSFLVLAFIFIGCFVDALWVLFLRGFIETMRKK